MCQVLDFIISIHYWLLTDYWIYRKLNWIAKQIVRCIMQYATKSLCSVRGSRLRGTWVFTTRRAPSGIKRAIMVELISRAWKWSRVARSHHVISVYKGLWSSRAGTLPVNCIHRGNATFRRWTRVSYTETPTHRDTFLASCIARNISNVLTDNNMCVYMRVPARYSASYWLVYQNFAALFLTFRFAV